MAARRRFAEDQSGNVAMIFGLSVAAMAVVLASGLSMERNTMARAQVQIAADNAVIFATREMTGTMRTDDAIEAEAIKVFRANLALGADVLDCADPDFHFDRANNRVTIDASCDSAVIGAKVLTRDELPAGAAASAMIEAGKAEVAFVFDVSGSMDDPSTASGNKKIDDLKSAARGAVATLLPTGEPVRTRVAFATYSTGVNAQGYYKKLTGVEPVAGDPQCISARNGAYEGKGDAPAPSRYFEAVSQCPANPSILPLTSNTVALNGFLDTLTPNGWTNAATGTHLGWGLVRQDWNGLWPSASKASPPSPNVFKAVVIMTDGKFNRPTDRPFERFDALCTGMKAEGIAVYTVGFELDDASAITAMNTCASPGKAKLAKNAGDLASIYAEIAREIRFKTLRLAS